MVLNDWADGETITERKINNLSNTKGTEAELAAIALADRENGSMHFNSTRGVLQVQVDATNEKRSNIQILIGADSTEVTQLGVTPLQVKDIDPIKSDEGFSYNQITIVAMLKTSSNNATLVMEVDGGPADEITVSTSSTSYTKVTGTYDATGLSNNAVHTLEFYIYTDNAGATASLKQLEVWGI